MIPCGDKSYTYFLEGQHLSTIHAQNIHESESMFIRITSRVYIYIYTYHRVITINLKDILGYLAPLLCGGCHVFLTGVEAAEPRPVWMDGCCSELTYATVGKPIGYLDVVS